MTQQEFTRQLPPFAYNVMGVKPPLMFNGVSARIFPLRANLDTLQQVCDGYLNTVPREAGYFRAMMPYAFLVVLDYGRMGEAVMSAGWFSQIEVYFGLPVEWYKFVGGRYVFHDWAVITPYIFVNDDVSVPVGRTVYGFPKILAQVKQTDSPWMKNPAGPVILASVATTVFPKAYTGGVLENRVFMEIERATISNFRLPFDAGSPMMPWTMASNLGRAMGGFGRDAMWLAQAMRIFPLNPAGDPRFLQEMLGRMPPWLAPGGAGFVLNSLNLKQFRRAADPSKICYRALTNGCMRTTGILGAGLLGEDHLLFGDLSGGHSIRLYENSSLPIAQTLGLEVNQTWSVNGAEVSEFKPVMPFWVEVDLKYDQGANVAWQTDDGIWRDETGAAFDAPRVPSPEFNTTVSTAIEAIAGPFQFTGTTIRVIPLLADKKKLQEFLESYINGALRDPIAHEEGTPEEHVQFEVWSRPPQAVNSGVAIGGNFAYVYLTASSFDCVTSKADNVGDWAKYELAFMIPVKWQRMSAAEWERKGDDGKPVHERGNWQTMGVGLVPAFTFVDNCITAISRLEIQGIAAGTATFVRPESVWLNQEGGPNPTQTLLRVNVEVLSALGAGQEAASQPVIEINRDDTDTWLGDAPETPWRLAEDLRQELGTKKGTKLQYWKDMKVARALALELLGNQAPVALYTLKQFRDVTDPDKACYQSLVRVPRVLREVFDMREIEETLAVHIRDYPALNIVEALGIQATRLDDHAAGIAYCAQGIRPFFIHATVDEPLAERLLSRAGTTEWTLYPEAFQTMLSDEKGAPGITVDRKAEKLQDDMDPSRTAETMLQARHRCEAKQVRRADIITVEQARKALSVADPQIVIESVLSREWSNFDPNARWRKGRRDLLKAFSSLPEGGEIKPFAEAELYRGINNMLAVPPGAVAAMISLDELHGGNGNSIGSRPARDRGVGGRESVELENLGGKGAAIRWREAMAGIIGNQSAFTALRLTMENSVDILSSVAVLGLRGVREAYKILNQKLEKQVPPGRPVQVPTAMELFEAGRKLMQSIAEIHGMPIAGEPSPVNNLDTLVLADSTRLGDLIKVLQSEFGDELRPGDSPEAILETARAHGEEFRELVELARKYCDVQQEALLNKMSRAYQKPDFCIRRDAIGADRDRLLPMTLSWDEDWYYGNKMTLL